ncbi:uncharacterized protein LOC143445651 [Clavelina lepadiformis]|uniref:uncharacterized protein LOC143445651 n=1 Tax=Clavelina lepadiformis TaxID=159417 RepID=UPI004042A1E0
MINSSLDSKMKYLLILTGTGDPHSLSQRWIKWTRSFNLYVNGIGVTDNVQKRSLLLHTVGEEVQELYYSLVSEQNAINQTYEETVNVLNEQFIPRANVHSGSSCNLLSSDTWEFLKKSKMKIIKKTPGSKKKLFGYGNDKPLPIRGTFEAVARNMRTISCDMRLLKVFDVKGDPHSLSQRWRKWTRSFNLYVNGVGVTDNVQKKSLLLHTAGEEVQELYYSLVSEQNAINQTYEEMVNVLNEQFIPRANVPFERHVFHQLVQNSNETVDQYVCRLRQRAATCEFENTDDRIRDQVLDKCYSRELQRKFLEQQTLTLADVMRIAKAHEAVIAQTKFMSSTPDSVRVNAVTGSRRNQIRSTNKEVKECFACGRKGHFKGDAQCPAKGKTCNKCGKVGHFGMKCRSRTIDYKRSPEHGRARKPRRDRPRTHAVKEEESTEHLA